jgi:hypothetical protein
MYEQLSPNVTIHTKELDRRSKKVLQDTDRILIAVPISTGASESVW